MSRDIRSIANDLTRFNHLLRTVPWFVNLGKPHAQDKEVVRIWSWAEWHGPEQGYGDWFGRYPAVVREALERIHSGRRPELDSAWQRIEKFVVDLAIPNVPSYRGDRDPWYGPTACVWQAGYIAALVGSHVLVADPLPEPIMAQWTWFVEGHWPCDYAEEPPGYLDESLVNVPAGKLLVF